MLSKAKLNEYRRMATLAHRMLDAMEPDQSDELIMMQTTCHATLALDVVPILLEEIERLQAKRPEPVMVKMDSRGGSA